MKASYILSIVGALVFSTLGGASWVAAGTGTAATAQPTPAQVQPVEGQSLQGLVAQSDSTNVMWRRPL
jgi:hypothetical protein